MPRLTSTPIKFTPKEIEAVMDALNRVLAGEHDGDIPIRYYERAIEKVAKP